MQEFFDEAIKRIVLTNKIHRGDPGAREAYAKALRAKMEALARKEIPLYMPRINQKNFSI